MGTEKERGVCFSCHGRVCARCYSKHRLHVHHKHYNTFGDENVQSDVAVLCEPCRMEYHALFDGAVNTSTLDRFLKTASLEAVHSRIRKLEGQLQARSGPRRESGKKRRVSMSASRTPEQRAARKAASAARHAAKVRFTLDKARAYFVKNGL